MKCPYCGAADTRVINSREHPDTVRRRRECQSCHRRFTTFERIEMAPLLVIKRDGRREEFNRQKILEGLRRACHKRPISMEQLDDLVSRVERELLNMGVAEIPSSAIGRLVMERLKLLDEIAYVRYASVYQRFQDVDSLAEEIEEFKMWKQRQEEEKAQLKLPV